jgi:hypothetical protein
MAFGSKKVAATGIDQSNVIKLASEALAARRATRVMLPVRLTCETPILLHRWTEKAVRQMLGKMTGLDMPREPKDLTKEFDESWYRNIEGEPVVPCRVIKACIIEGAISTGKLVSKAELKREMRVRGYTAPLKMKGGKVKDHLTMDVRIAANQGGSPDIRSRALVPAGAWCDVVLDFPKTLSPDKVIAALAAAGETIGLCDWRPERGGEFGVFSVDLLKEGDIERILKENTVPEDEFKIPPELLRAFNAIPTEKLKDSGKKVKALLENVASQNGTSSVVADANGTAE